jgi:hypothetical protein
MHPQIGQQFNVCRIANRLPRRIGLEREVETYNGMQSRQIDHGHMLHQPAFESTDL